MPVSGGRSAKVRDFGLLLLFGGSSSIVFGVVYGSYFGIGLSRNTRCGTTRWRAIRWAHVRRHRVRHRDDQPRPDSQCHQPLSARRCDRRFPGQIRPRGSAVLLGCAGAVREGAAIESRGLTGFWIILFLVVPMVAGSSRNPWNISWAAPAGSERGGAAGWPALSWNRSSGPSRRFSATSPTPSALSVLRPTP